MLGRTIGRGEKERESAIKQIINGTRHHPSAEDNQSIKSGVSSLPMSARYGLR
jgi:hypothetical protein